MLPLPQAIIAPVLTIAALSACSTRPAPQDFSVPSPTLSGYLHRPMQIHAQVLTPADYAASGRPYPVIYWIPPFGSSVKIGKTAEKRWLQAFADVRREAIVVYLDPYFNGRHTVFADSANNGPWGTALVDDFVPKLERTYRVQRGEQFVTGHSSGAWAALWLKAAYPRTFSGACSIAPDPVDFHDFLGIDLTRPRGENFFRDGLGRERGFIRVNGADRTTLRRFAQDFFGNLQLTSFEASFSPRTAKGALAPLFDRSTGAIEPAVAAYWERNYDVSKLLQERARSQGDDFARSLHVIVGSLDTYHLDGPVRIMSSRLPSADVRVVPGADHRNIIEKADAIDYCTGALLGR